jgi:hypothetical protein
MTRSRILWRLPLGQMATSGSPILVIPPVRSAACRWIPNGDGSLFLLPLQESMFGSAFANGLTSKLYGPEQQQRALDEAAELPPKLVDPQTSSAYVLIPARDYEVVCEVLEDERQQRAKRKAALRNAIGRMDEQP